jgi:hypothetical protein
MRACRRLHRALPRPIRAPDNGKPVMEVVEILFATSFWAAAIRIATPLIFGVLNRHHSIRYNIKYFNNERIAQQWEFPIYTTSITPSIIPWRIY